MFDHKKRSKSNHPETYPKLSLLCVQGEYAGMSFPVTPDENISIGKNPEVSNIIISDAGVSRLHCTIQYSSGRDCYIVTDYSSNGVYLDNGTRLEKAKPTQVKSNSSVFFGKNTQLFTLVQEEPVSQNTEPEFEPEYHTEQIASTPPSSMLLAKRPPKMHRRNAPNEDRMAFSSGSEKHSVPKCTHCGYEGEWKLESLVRPMDIIITILLLFFWGAGLIYLLVVVLIRMNPDNRAKICPSCQAKNLWTFYY